MNVAVRTTVLLTAAAGVVATAGAGFAARAEQTARIADRAILEQIVSTKSSDLGKKGSSVGDRLALRSRAFLDGKTVGFGGSDLVVIKPHPVKPVYLVMSTLRLRDGDISVVGLYDSARSKNSVPIAGGTGRYLGMTGRQDFVELPDGRFRSTFHFGR